MSPNALSKARRPCPGRLNHGEAWGLIDYLVDELATSYRLGKQVWERIDSHEAKMRLFQDAVNRAKIRVNLSREEDLYGSIKPGGNP